MNITIYSLEIVTFVKYRMSEVPYLHIIYNVNLHKVSGVPE